MTDGWANAPSWNCGRTRGRPSPTTGLVTDKIPKRADMERFSTVAELDMQAGIVSPVFDKIYAGIFR